MREGHPARALAATAPLDFVDDDEVEEGALPVADPVLELDDPEPVELEELGGVPSADDALAVAWNASKDFVCCWVDGENHTLLTVTISQMVSM